MNIGTACCRRAECSDFHCPGRPVTAEGGAQIEDGSITRRDEPPVTTDDFFTWAEDMWRAGLTVAKWIAAVGLFLFVLGLSAGYFHR